MTSTCFRLPLALAICATLCGSALFAQSGTDGGAYHSDASGTGPGSYAPRKLDPIYFPPVAPALGDALPSSADCRTDAPRELADFVSESFYPVLSSYLSTDFLKPDQYQRLEAYRTARDTLVGELRSQLTQLQGRSREERAQALQTFAGVQTPRIRDVNRIGEALHLHLLKNASQWNEYRRWSLRDPEAEKLIKKGLGLPQLVARGVAYYGLGLSEQQRRLLREIGAELKPCDKCGKVCLPEMYKGTNDFTFSPFTSRVHLPANLSPALREQIATYRKLKDELKDELREIVLENDERWVASPRAFAIRVPKQQEAKFEALERQAEVIRTQLAAEEVSPIMARTDAAYKDYQRAVLEPGLSPEQRDLLFDAAVVQLRLPLPPAENKPGLHRRDS